MTTEEAKTETGEEQRKHVHEILAKTPDVMFITSAQTEPRPVQTARPLHVTRLDDDGGMWFMVGLDSRKVKDVERFDEAMVTGQHKSRWIHVSGKAQIVTDRAKVRELWSKFHAAWFPLGPDDPNVGLIHFQPQHAEYWDNSGVLGIKYLFEVAVAVVTGRAAETVKGVHGSTMGDASAARES